MKNAAIEETTDAAIQEMIGELCHKGGASIDQVLQIAAYIMRLNADAERYIKIKNNRSPFTVKYYGARLLNDGRNLTQSCELLTPELDEMIDSWPEEEHDV